MPSGLVRVSLCRVQTPTDDAYSRQESSLLDNRAFGRRPHFTPLRQCRVCCHLSQRPLARASSLCVSAGPAARGRGAAGWCPRDPSRRSCLSATAHRTIGWLPRPGGGRTSTVSSAFSTNVAGRFCQCVRVLWYRGAARLNVQKPLLPSRRTVASIGVHGLQMQHAKLLWLLGHVHGGSMHLLSDV